MTIVEERRRRITEEPERSAEILKIQLQEVLADTTDELLTPLMEILAKLDVDIRTAPSPGLLMMNICASDQTVFHLGEVLVTRAEVSLNGQTGFGCCLGDRPDSAIALASLDALCRCDTAAAPFVRIGEAIDQIYRQVSLQRAAESRLAALTQVDFHSKAEE
jgi:phosphonate C-P lyase system protein PhnG